MPLGHLWKNNWPQIVHSYFHNCRDVGNNLRLHNYSDIGCQGFKTVQCQSQPSLKKFIEVWRVGSFVFTFVTTTKSPSSRPPSLICSYPHEPSYRHSELSSHFSLSSVLPLQIQLLCSKPEISNSLVTCKDWRTLSWFTETAILAREPLPWDPWGGGEVESEGWSGADHGRGDSLLREWSCGRWF